MSSWSRTSACPTSWPASEATAFEVQVGFRIRIGSIKAVFTHGGNQVRRFIGYILCARVSVDTVVNGNANDKELVDSVKFMR